MNVKWMPMIAIKKPPIACPKIEPVSQVAELMVVAEGSKCLGTTLEISDENVGPENARIIPVQPITKNTQQAVTQGWSVLMDLSDKKNKMKIQPR